MLFKPLNSELNPMCHLLALLGAHHILHISRMRVKASVETQGSVINEIIDMAHCLNGTDKLRPKYREKNLSWCHFAHHKSHRTGMESIPGPQF